MKPIDLLESEYQLPASPIIIGGCGRSGTTLLRCILNAHPDVVIGPESNLFLPDPVQLRYIQAVMGAKLDTLEHIAKRSRCRAEFIDIFFDFYTQLHEGRIWGEKTPRNVRRLDWIFAHFPSARFVHVIRDGRDVTCSLRSHPRYITGQDGRLMESNKHSAVAPAAMRWVHDVGLGLKWKDDKRYIEVRYERLVQDTEQQIRELCTRLGLRIMRAALEAMLGHHLHDHGDPAMFPQNQAAVEPVYTDSVERWRRDMTEQEVAEFNHIGGDLNVELGYSLT